MSDDTVMPKKENRKPVICIKTFGCQMNVYDSQVAEGFLKNAGYEIYREHEDETAVLQKGSDPKRGLTPFDADVVLMNTCSVREHAEDRVYGRIGMLGEIKRTNPDLIVGLMGCMVEEHKEKLFKRFPQLDLMVGTRNIKELAGLIEEVRHTRRQVSRIRQDGLSIEYTDLINRNNAFHAWLPIMTGCNKVCTFCIVPITRGSEVSMPAREVYREASRLVGEGVKWITLLGQNVNSYAGSLRVGESVIPAQAGIQNSGSPIKTFGDDKQAKLSGGTRHDMNFPELLDMLCQIDGLDRLSFTTSHPHDATEKLYRVIARNPRISRRFHLPLQSGSDRILRRMKRLHTYEEYKAKIDLMRAMIPDISITTDIIAGFSGEADEDHLATITALDQIRYDNAFIYKYSVRPGTPAANLPDNVPHEVKEKRNGQLLSLQRKITVENSRKWIGRIVNVFAEEVNKRDATQLIGRTEQDKKVVFPGSQEFLGRFVKVQLTELRHETFVGVLSHECLV